MKTRIFHPGNAGLLFTNNNTTVLIDGIYDGLQVGMSKMPLLWQQILQPEPTALQTTPTVLQSESKKFLKAEQEDFSKAAKNTFPRIDALIFTHIHEDHFCRERVRDYLNRHPMTGIYGGQDMADTVPMQVLKDGTKHLVIGCAEIFAGKTEHDGQWYKEDAHESILLKMNDECFFIAGDAKLSQDDIKTFSKYANHVRLAFVNLYQLGDYKQMDSLNMLSPDCVVLYHLPKEEDDVWNYLLMAKQYVKRARKRGIHIEVMEHMKWFEGGVQDDLY